jgi:hypothetical protein
MARRFLAAALLSSDTDIQLSFMVLRIASFIPAAWAIFIAYYLHHINRDPHQDDFGPHSLTALVVGIVMLNLLIAVPIRGVRLAATLVLFAFVVVLFLN